MSRSSALERARAPGIGLVLATLALWALPGCGEPHAEAPLFPADAVEHHPEPQHFEVPPPPFSEGVFPCSECHFPEDMEDMPMRLERRELKMAHKDIVLHHDEEHRWCLDCHDANDRDHLRLANGTLVPFEESYRLCGQCHGDKYRDWRAGVHGRRVGDWDGEKQYLLCVNCHNSHAPAYPLIEPMPTPRAPERTP